MSSHFESSGLLPKSRGLYYNGTFHEATSTAASEVFSAGTGNLLARIANASAVDTESAIDAAHAAFVGWWTTPLAQRAKAICEAAKIVRAHAEELAALESLNIGSPIAIMRGDAIHAAQQMEWFAGMAHAVTGNTHNLSETTLNYTVREPLGVVARIVASNHPLMFACVKLASALVMGNTVIIKPPEQAPLTGLRLAELIGHLFPPGVLNIIPGGAECGRALSCSRLVRKITLVGSVPTGKSIQRDAAGTLKHIGFELGGKNALVAYPDADRTRLIEGIVSGMNWGWAGQSCGSTSRIFLHSSIYDDVLAAAADRIQAKFKVGDPMDQNTTMGSLVSKAAQLRVLNYIESAKNEGARVVIGGGVPGNLPGYFVYPTVLADVKQTMRVAQEEIFGPVLSVISWDDEEEMLRQVNSVEYGLTGSVFTTCIETAHRTARRIESGTVWVNTVSTHFLGLPFGGYKSSGIGRDGCLQELEDLTQIKAIHIKLAG